MGQPPPPCDTGSSSSVCGQSLGVRAQGGPGAGAGCWRAAFQGRLSQAPLAAHPPAWLARKACKFCPAAREAPDGTGRVTLAQACRRAAALKPAALRSCAASGCPPASLLTTSGRSSRSTLTLTNSSFLWDECMWEANTTELRKGGTAAAVHGRGWPAGRAALARRVGAKRLPPSPASSRPGAPASHDGRHLLALKALPLHHVAPAGRAGAGRDKGAPPPGLAAARTQAQAAARPPGSQHQPARSKVERHHNSHTGSPVAGGVADGQEDGAVEAPRALKRLLPPRQPVHRVVRVLQQVCGAPMGGERAEEGSHRAGQAWLQEGSGSRQQVEHPVGCAQCGPGRRQAALPSAAAAFASCRLQGLCSLMSALVCLCCPSCCCSPEPAMAAGRGSEVGLDKAASGQGAAAAAAAAEPCGSPSNAQRSRLQGSPIWVRVCRGRWRLPGTHPRRASRHRLSGRPVASDLAPAAPGNIASDRSPAAARTLTARFGPDRGPQRLSKR